MNMKDIANYLLLAGAALAAVPALALTPASLPADVVYRIAGASAQDPGLDAIFASWCTNLDRYSNSTTQFPGNNNSAWFCNATGAANTFPVAAGTKVLVIKRAQGGSLVGPSQVVNNTLLGNMVVDATCAKSGANTYYTCAGTETTSRAQIGLSDVETNIWKARGQFTASQGFTEKVCGAQAFGVAVTTAMYNGLQADQVAAGTIPAGGQPVLSKAEVTASISDSGAIFFNGDWSGLTASGAGKNIQICDRTNTSGTQAALEMYFLGSPCSNAAGLFGKLSVATQAGNPGVVWEAASTGAVKTCLNNADLNKDPNGNATVNSNWAMGFMSMENVPGAGETWKFVKLDGFSPNFLPSGAADAHQTENFERGGYMYGFESTLQYVGGAPVSTLGDNICKALGNPVNAPRGIAAVATSGCTPGPGGQCMKFTRNGNSCQLWQ